MKQDKATTKALAIYRRTKMGARIVELIGNGLDEKRIAATLQEEGYKATVATVRAQFAAFRKNLSESMQADFAAQQRILHGKLLALEELVRAKGAESNPNYINDLRGIWSDLGKLLGLNAPSRSMSVSATVETGSTEALAGYRRFVSVTKHLDAVGLERVFEFASKLQGPALVQALPPERTEFDEVPQLEAGKA